MKCEKGCSYSRAMNQDYPRQCVVCGIPEEVFRPVANTPPTSECKPAKVEPRTDLFCEHCQDRLFWHEDNKFYRCNSGHIFDVNVSELTYMYKEGQDHVKAGDKITTPPFKPAKEECQAGCVSLTGDEKRHHKDCFYYPESFTKMYDDLKFDYEALKSVSERVEEMQTKDFLEQKELIKALKTTLCLLMKGDRK